VRGLLKMLMVAGMVAAIGVAAWALSAWWAGEERTPAVVVEIDPPAREEGIVPLRGRAALYTGPPRQPTDVMIPVDESEEVNLERQEVPRFELTADPSDGTRFFVYAWMELSNYDIVCDTVALPPLRHAKDESGEPIWLNAETGEPLRSMRIELSKKCQAIYG
jgi:hypothetical protein